MIDCILPICKTNLFELSISFKIGYWCDPKEIYNDWRVIKGITRYFSLNGRQTIAYAYRFDEEKEYYEVCAFTADENGKVVKSNSITLQAGEDSIYATCELDQDGYAHYVASSEGGEYINAKHGFKHFDLGRELGYNLCIKTEFKTHK